LYKPLSGIAGHLPGHRTFSLLGSWTGMRRQDLPIYLVGAIALAITIGAIAVLWLTVANP